MAWMGLRGGRLRRLQACHFACPRSGEPVASEIVQDIRTGQWKSVRSCSIFLGEERVRCDQDCARLMNLGWRPSPAERP